MLGGVLLTLVICERDRGDLGGGAKMAFSRVRGGVVGLEDELEDVGDIRSSEAETDFRSGDGLKMPPPYVFTGLVSAFLLPCGVLSRTYDDVERLRNGFGFVGVLKPEAGSRSSEPVPSSSSLALLAGCLE
jgi:hypothetical protein